MEKEYHLGLLYFIHLLIKADGVTEPSELEGLSKIRAGENISAETFKEFEDGIRSKTDNEIYLLGLENLKDCTDTQKLKVFATLYRLAEIDGTVHSKEIRLLLYAVKNAGVKFNQVVDFAKSNPSNF